MKEYKVIRVKFNAFKMKSLPDKITEIINTHSRTGWSLEQLETGQYGIFIVLSKPKMM